jgi:hypothetical protein
MCDGRRQREEEEEAKFCFGRLKSLCQAIEWTRTSFDSSKWTMLISPANRLIHGTEEHDWRFTFSQPIVQIFYILFAFCVTYFFTYCVCCCYISYDRK